MNTSGRRRRQAVNRYRHLDPLRRPRYHIVSKEKAAKRLDIAIATERRMNAGKRKKPA